MAMFEYDPEPEVDIGTQIAKVKMITKSKQPRKNQCWRRNFSPARKQTNNEKYYVGARTMAKVIGMQMGSCRVYFCALLWE